MPAPSEFSLLVKGDARCGRKELSMKSNRAAGGTDYEV
jgi:hypothetical protein